MAYTATVGKVAFSLIVLISTLSGSAAFAQGKADVFNRSTAPSLGGISSQRPISGNAALGNNTPVARWFDSIDQAWWDHARIEPKDQMTLARNFDGDAKKVAEWSSVVKATAQKYREYARVMRTLPTPPGMGPDAKQLQDYRNSTAEYYDDCAEYFEDWIRPRRPAATKDELETQLSQMHQRSANLKTQLTTLQMFDKQLRDQFDVRPRDDKLMQYVAKRPNQ